MYHTKINLLHKHKRSKGAIFESIQKKSMDKATIIELINFILESLRLINKRYIESFLINLHIVNLSSSTLIHNLIQVR